MLYNLLLRIYNRYRPQEGWLSVWLLLAIAGTLTASVAMAEWVPEGSVVNLTALVGLLVGALLAKGRMRAIPAGLLILGYALASSALYLAGAMPWHILLQRGDMPAVAFARQSLALFLDRMGGWLRAALQGGSSEETIAFAFGLGLLAGLATAYLAWSTYRRHQPLAGLTVLGLALALNSYYSSGDADAWLVAIFVGLATLLAAAIYFADLERSWTRQGTDYSGQIRLELLLAALAVAMGLLAVSFVLPAIRFRAIAHAFHQTAPVQQAEETLQRVFAGVRDPFPEGSGGGGAGGPGILPRAFLLGNAPELSETLVMTATLSGPAGLHWQATSYDIYTGRGWARSEERQESFPAGVDLPHPTFSQQTVLTQTIYWRLDERRTRYTMGRPLRFDQETTTYWRGLDDFVRALGPPAGIRRYTVVSELPTSAAELLRQARLADVPPALLARYTQLPGQLPGRVGELAQEITAGLATPYDQARAIERFLRQYPYSLDVPPPPTTRDPVDFFLFELQSGYCDYYASAMVVLARSVGLPARLDIGYLSQPEDARGVQTIYHINAHSWPEVYFPGYGWVAFEPTASFPTAGQGPATRPGDLDPPAFDQPAPPLPQPDTPPPAGRISAWWSLPPILLILLGWWLFNRWQAQQLALDGVLWAYARLQRAGRGLGQPTPPSQTPAEFQQALLQRLAALPAGPRLARLLAPTRPGIETLVQSFTRRQYSPDKPTPAGQKAARATWRQLRTPLLLARWLRRRQGGDRG